MQHPPSPTMTKHDRVKIHFSNKLLQKYWEFVRIRLLWKYNELAMQTSSRKYWEIRSPFRLKMHV